MESNKLILEAIALHKAITATYNRMVATLAPHILYTRHGELYLDAVTIERDGQPPREVKLGAFKVTGLTELALTNQTFEPVPFFNPDDPKYVAATLFSVETQSSVS
ncbi:WYL domain-containing protein [Rhizorhapis sp. SPR117]|uniref:WYL domain-containing protein n=1 Tax=Rhizorhapis sp. SPR117 TaxID=2912611 RepID=UPI001F267630|nr:WYL domain-containing protein [Rhizorhapis sp. SPR117]